MREVKYQPREAQFKLSQLLFEFRSQKIDGALKRAILKIYT